MRVGESEEGGRTGEQQEHGGEVLECMVNQDKQETFPGCSSESPCQTVVCKDLALAGLARTRLRCAAESSENSN